MTALTIVAHDGTFHTDDVFACATLSLALVDKEIEIVRSRDQEVIDKADIVVDVGGIYDPSLGRFDHHQKGGAGARDNGIPYASFGLVWKEYGATLCGSETVAKFIDERLVQAIDAHDNGYGADVLGGDPRPYVVGDIISSFRPTWQEHTTNDQCFMEACNMATQILERMIVQTKAYSEAATHIEDAYECAPDKRVIELPEEYPGWQDVLGQYPEPLYIVYQRSNGSWGIKCIPLHEQSFALRKSLPEAWAGLSDQALVAVTGVSGALFCHNNRFLVVASSKEGVLTLAKLALAA